MVERLAMQLDDSKGGWTALYSVSKTVAWRVYLKDMTTGGQLERKLAVQSADVKALTTVPQKALLSALL